MPTGWEAVIGLEVHAQLLTRGKMFCRCGADYAAAAPNTRVCPVCLGLPGALPVINRKAIELTIRTGLALGSEIADFTRFDRKNYFYPDLMKGYQISQYEFPLCVGGRLPFVFGGEDRTAGITRVHLEEDTAKHSDRDGEGGAFSLIDVNRAGVPLIEIVGEPDLRAPDEAREYLRALRGILRYIGASTGNMDEGALRCDANVSVRRHEQSTYGTKVEIKNMNSFRSVSSAVAFEIGRQIAIIEAGGSITQETRGWDDTRGVTVGQRSKEYAHDYRYFPEPDLPPIRPSATWVNEIRQAMPELPAARRRRYVQELGLSPYDAALLSGEREYAEFFDAAIQECSNAKGVANWMNGDLRRLLGERTIEESAISPGSLASLVKLVDGGEVNRGQAQAIIEVLCQRGGDAAEIAHERGFRQVSDESAIGAAIEAAIAGNPKSVADFRAGRSQAMGFLVGQVMKAMRGHANPAVVNRLLSERLSRSD
ncbi:MAG: Asp-tRNA(Asn)/Glu-tRNA(Gln) amidotransferase subunit GatB [Chloroflexota bacterium]|nr:MAG: Asp-tRNA(Asn)/Glu-tRNA(Gln) amidotransferase subunit GatB [Chloroflexota bacterium]